MGRGSLKNESNKDLPPLTNGLGKKQSNDIEILHTEILIKEMGKVFAASHPDPLDIEKAKKSLKGHKLSLIDAIAQLADTSDGEILGPICSFLPKISWHWIVGFCISRLPIIY